MVVGAAVVAGAVVAGLVVAGVLEVLNGSLVPLGTLGTGGAIYSAPS